MIHVGVDLHQRFCYMTALEARGKIVQAGAVTNEKSELRKYFRGFRGQRVQVAVEACGFWPAFREVVEPICGGAGGTVCAGAGEVDDISGRRRVFVFDEGQSQAVSAEQV